MRASAAFFSAADCTAKAISIGAHHLIERDVQSVEALSGGMENDIGDGGHDAGFANAFDPRSFNDVVAFLDTAFTGTGSSSKLEFMIRPHLDD